jgi:hypothetical protein
MEGNLSMNFFFSPDMASAWIVGIWILNAVVHVGFACAVWADTGLMQRQLRRQPFLVGGIMWALATLLGGIFVAAVYWVIHHSTLRPSQRTDAPAPAPGSSGQ